MPPLPPLHRLARPAPAPLTRPLHRLPHHHYHPQRHASPTTATASTPAAAAPPPPRARRSLRPYITATVFLALGLAAGHLVRVTLAPPPLPPTGSDMDAALRASLERDLDALPVVRRLARGGSDDEEGSEGEGVWREVGSSSSSGAGAGAEGAKGAEGYVHGTLAGMRGLGPWRRWWNPRSGEAVLVFWLGGGVTGWPGVAHGGFIATMFVEGFKDAVGEHGGGGKAGENPIDTINLTLTYLAPTLSSNFYVLRTAPAPQLEPGTGLPPQKDMTKKQKRGAGALAAEEEEMTGTLETVGGKVCVKAKAVVRR
ncbi:uncharacterized protein K452DRAFT_303155 [Aplosporella prunicola CBS 121167]|uniref:Thioesterase domain-containing protein n=1 Tax=Aplosporella prunicola CBS 121167 TaxID=1176127 RepID=A0A6A6AYV3_9PEZI|nr:uncharacterized protein K452DRAFT_303155 [Aplosporella prunicola CBS 121167]KAF2135947.1 hypothetical protein K452DRAFT_303155 [Aplosporella prunicola CBS 121167]